MFESATWQASRVVSELRMSDDNCKIVLLTTTDNLLEVKTLRGYFDTPIRQIVQVFRGRHSTLYIRTKNNVMLSLLDRVLGKTEAAIEAIPLSPEFDTCVTRHELTAALRQCALPQPGYSRAVRQDDELLNRQYQRRPSRKKRARGAILMQKKSILKPNGRTNFDE